MDSTTHFSFVVPGAPVPCARARVFSDRVTGKMRAARPAKTAAYEKHVATCAKLAANLARWECVPGEYGISIHIARAAKRGDWDNYAKAITDGMLGIAYPDDRMITMATVYMSVEPDKPRVHVVVWRVDKEAA